MVRVLCLKKILMSCEVNFLYAAFKAPLGGLVCGLDSRQGLYILPEAQPAIWSPPDNILVVPDKILPDNIIIVPDKIPPATCAGLSYQNNI